MKLNIDTKTKNLIMMIASIVIVAAFLILPILSVSMSNAGQSVNQSKNGFDLIFDHGLDDAPALVVIGTILVIAGGAAAIYFNFKPNKQYFLYAAIGAAVGAIFIMLGWSDEMKQLQEMVKVAKQNGASGGAGYGLGFWLSLIASAVCIAGCFVKANDEQ